MHEIAPLIHDLAVILGTAAIVTLIFQRIKQPIVLGYLVAGIIIGPYTPPHSLVSDIPNIKIISELGVIFLMFSLGLEFSFHKLVRVGFSAGFTGFFEMVFMTIIGFAVGKLIGWSFFDCLFLGAALAISSTTIIIKAISELGLMKKRFAELIFGVLVVEDLFAILLLVVLSTVVISKNFWSAEIIWSTGKLILVVGGWFLAGYFLVPTLFRKVMQHANDETLTVVAVALCLFLVTAAAYFHYSSALGAFIMGSILAETPLIRRIEHLITPIRDIFAAVFFVSVGMLIEPKIIIEQWPVVLLITVVTIVGKLLTTGLGALLTGQSLNTSLRVGFSMAQVGEFSFIIIGLGLALNVISPSLYSIIVAVSGITTFTTPYLIRYSENFAKKIDTKLPEKVKYILASYAAAVYRGLNQNNEQGSLRKIILRVLINAIVIAIIFTLTYKLILPELIKIFAQLWVAKIVCWLLALLLSSPFIWGMLFAFKVGDRAREKSSFSFAIMSIWLLTLFEIAALSISYFQTWVLIFIFITMAIIFFFLAYRHLEKTYHWFEQHLVKNVSRKSTRARKYEELAPWDTHLVEVTVNSGAAFVGKTLTQCQLRQKFGINIVAIQRNDTLINSPRGEEKLLAHDKLIILGNDEQIDLFRKNIEHHEPEKEDENVLDNFALKSIFLQAENAYIGKTIRESQVREQMDGVVVGLEHNGVRVLNPDSTALLKEGDTLFIVVKESTLAESES